MDKAITTIIIAALRKLWLIRGSNRREAIKEATIGLVEGRMRVARVCQSCGKVMRDRNKEYDVDHITAVRSPPWDINNPDWGLFINRLFYGKCEVLCKICHKAKTKTPAK